MDTTLEDITEKSVDAFINALEHFDVTRLKSLQVSLHEANKLVLDLITENKRYQHLLQQKAIEKTVKDYYTTRDKYVADSTVT